MVAIGKKIFSGFLVMQRNAALLDNAARTLLLVFTIYLNNLAKSSFGGIKKCTVPLLKKEKKKKKKKKREDHSS